MNVDANIAFAVMHAAIVKINKNKLKKDLLCQHIQLTLSKVINVV